MKDTELPIKLIDKLMLVYNNVEMARVTGVPMKYLSTRGQAIKVLSQLLRFTKLYDYVIPSSQQNPQQQPFEGAFVIEPKKGF